MSFIVPAGVKDIPWEKPINGFCPTSPCGAHWWRIDDDRMPLVNGTCRYCLATRVFCNTFDMSFSERHMSPSAVNNIKGER